MKDTNPNPAQTQLLPTATGIEIVNLPPQTRALFENLFKVLAEKPDRFSIHFFYSEHGEDIEAYSMVISNADTQPDIRFYG